MFDELKIATKLCAMCGQEKPLLVFAMSKGRYNTACMDCHNTKTKAIRKRDTNMKDGKWTYRNNFSFKPKF